MRLDGSSVQFSTEVALQSMRFIQTNPFVVKISTVHLILNISYNQLDIVKTNEVNAYAKT
jgi:hypothetical protein